MPNLLFNRVHGVNVRIGENGEVAERVSNDSGGGILFSNRPVQNDEKVCIKFLNVSTDGYAGLRFGFTTSDPTSFQSPLGFYTGLATRPEFWAKDLWMDSCRQGNILYYSVNSDGDVDYGINGEEKEVFLYELKSRGPRWVLIELFGQSTSIQFVDSIRPSPTGDGKIANDQSTTTAVPLLALDSSYVLPGTSSTNNGNSSSLLTILSFHSTKGEDVQILGGGNRACRNRPSPFSILKSVTNSYVFTSRSISIGENFVVKVNSVDKKHKYKENSVVFGVTSCNPDSIRAKELPKDPNCLLDRSEYWIVKDNLIEDVCVGDQLSFTFSYSGEILMSRNKGSSQILVHVDNSVPLWAFFDLCGVVTELQLVENNQNEGAKIDNWNSQTRSNTVSTPTSPLNPLPTAPENVLIDFSDDAEIVTSPSFTMPKMMPIPISTHNFNTTTSPTNETNPIYEECMTCCERRVDSVFLPCGHQCMCYPCSFTYWKVKMQNVEGEGQGETKKDGCPICRSPCSGVIRTYNC